jgi:hypothetical protein
LEYSFKPCTIYIYSSKTTKPLYHIQIQLEYHVQIHLGTLYTIYQIQLE